MERDHFGDIVIDVRILLKWVLKKLCGGLDWIKLGEDRNEK
jgi:hypothetical protein